MTTWVASSPDNMKNRRTLTRTYKTAETQFLLSLDQHMPLTASSLQQYKCTYGKHTTSLSCVQGCPLYRYDLLK